MVDVCAMIGRSNVDRACHGDARFPAGRSGFESCWKHSSRSVVDCKTIERMCVL